MGQTIQQQEAQPSNMSKGPDSSAVAAKRKRAKPGVQDFEEIFGKDIDQFLEDSEWDANEQARDGQGDD